jgi:hypothetical protein
LFVYLPVARIGNPGRACLEKFKLNNQSRINDFTNAIADTARKAIGRIALPETPPYVVF